MAVQMPNREQLRAVARQCGLSLDDASVDSFRALFTPYVEAYNIVAAMPDEGGEAVRKVWSWLPKIQSARKVRSSASSMASLRSRLMSGIVVNPVGVDAADETVEERCSFGLSSLVGVVSLFGQDGQELGAGAEVGAGLAG